MTNLETIIRGLIGVITLLSVCYIFSANRKKINWSIVSKGLIIQIIFAICILKVPFIEDVFPDPSIPSNVINKAFFLNISPNQVI